MPAPATADAFLEMVRKSGLVPADKLDAFLQNKPGLEGDPPQFASQLVSKGLLTKFQAQQILKGRFKNFSIGRYRVLEPLGAGGMSRVYLCEHTAMGHRVAMKLLPVQQGADPSLVERFFREARAVAALNHPNIVRAHDVAEESGKFFYLIMDYVDGINLHDLIARNGPLSPTRAAHYIAQAAEGLQHIHENGLVHRDLKPGNLLLDRQGTIKVLDLGLARFNHPEPGPGGSITARYDDKAILGTADYLSPEQAIQSSNVDIRSDIYSLGATIYYLLAGRPPFVGENVTQKLLAHQMKKPESLLVLRPDLPKELVAVVDKMMAKRGDDRFQQPVDVAAALSPWTSQPIDPPGPEEMPAHGPGSAGAASQITSRAPRTGSGIRKANSSSALSARTPGPREQMSSSIFTGDATNSKKRWLVFGGAGIGLALLGGLAIWLFSGGKKPATSPEPQVKTEKSTGGPGMSPPPKVAAVAPLPATPDGALVVAPKGAAFTTIGQAIASAKPGDRIVVVAPDHFHEEALSALKPPANLTIEAWPAGPQPLVWRAPAGHASDKPLVDLAGCNNFKLKGFTFDGREALPDLVHIRGSNPGLILEDVQLRAFGRCGVRFIGAGGAPGQPVKLQRLRFSANQDVPAAVAFDRGAADAACRYVQINGCRFEGPFGAGLAINGPVNELDVVENRFFRVVDGIRYAKFDPAPQLQLTVAANTFSDLRAGLHLETVPPADSSRITVIDNLFLKTSKLALLDGIVSEPSDGPVWVWHNDKQPAKIPPPEKRYFRKTFDVAKVPDKGAALDIGCVQNFKVWINGTQIGASGPAYFNKRVYAFDIAAALKPGKNVIAVEGENKVDPFNPGYGVSPGLCVRLQFDGKTIATDDTWKSNKSGDAGWLTADFADAEWSAVLPWPTSGPKYLWAEAVWDSEVARQLGKARVPLMARGNARDYLSGEAYPLLESLRGFVAPLPTDPANDATFLRYDTTSPLNSAGHEKGPVGCRPAN